jgi:hypothetical protein
MMRGRTIVNAVVGAVVAVVLSFVPFSTVLGGAVAGFLEGPDERAGAIAGGLAGAITFLPFLGLGALLLGVLGLGLAGGASFGGIVFVSIVIVGIGLFVLAYTVGLSLLGGYLGAYLAREYPDRRRRTREAVGFETDTSRESDATPERDRRSGSARDRPASSDLESDRPDPERDRGREPE